MIKNGIMRKISKTNHNYKSIIIKTCFYNFSLNVNKGKLPFDPYLALNISRKAEWTEIKKQYYKLARQYHPDLNKNDERSKLKFLQIKEAYEYFDRRFNPAKYSNLKPRFDFETESKNNKESDDDFVSIRDTMNKNKSNKKSDFSEKSGSSDDKVDDSENEKGKSAYSSKGFTFREGSSDDYFKQEQVHNEIKQQEYIHKFLKDRYPNPRSEKMVDRLGLKNETIGRAKFFGADSFLSFFVVTLLLWYFVIKKLHKFNNQTYKDLKMMNILNIIRVGEMSDLEYTPKKSERTPLEKSLSETKEYREYVKESTKEVENILKKNEGQKYTLKTTPKIDIKDMFNKSLEKE